MTLISRIIAGMLALASALAPAVAAAASLPPATPASIGAAPLNGLGRLPVGNQPAGSLPFGFQPVAPVAAPPIVSTGTVTATLTKGSTNSITGSTKIPATSPAIRLLGPPQTYNATTTYYGVSSMPSAAGSPRKISFWSDAPILEYRFAGGNMAAELRVNGQTVQVGGASLLTTDTSGQPYRLKIDWTVGGTITAATVTRVPRKYELEGLGILWDGINIATNATGDTDAVWYPVEDDQRPLMMVFGDSYTNGVGATTYWQTAPAIMAAALGYEYWGDGYGGAGWLSASPADVPSRMATGIFVVRTTDGAGTIKTRPGVPAVVSFFGYNDSSGNQASIAAAALAWAQSIRATMGPKVPIVIMGPWTPLGPTPNLTATEATLQGVVASLNAAGDPLVSFLSLDTIVTSGNAVRYGKGDNIHPNGAGHLFVGLQAALQVRNLLGW